MCLAIVSVQGATGPRGKPYLSSPLVAMLCLHISGPKGQLFLHNHACQQLPSGEHEPLLRGTESLPPLTRLLWSKNSTALLFLPSVFENLWFMGDALSGILGQGLQCPSPLLSSITSLNHKANPPPQKTPHLIGSAVSIYRCCAVHITTPLLVTTASLWPGPGLQAVINYPAFCRFDFQASLRCSDESSHRAVTSDHESWPENVCQTPASFPKSPSPTGA